MANTINEQVYLISKLTEKAEKLARRVNSLENAMAKFKIEAEVEETTEMEQDATADIESKPKEIVAIDMEPEARISGIESESEAEEISGVDSEPEVEDTKEIGIVTEEKENRQ